MDVLCLGIFVADVVAKPIEKMPDKGKLVLVDTLELHTGGCASNTGYALSKLGISTGLMGKVGTDGFGDFFVNYMNDAGLDIRGIKRTSTSNTSATMVMVSSDGERTFFHYLGANAELCYEDINFDIIKDAKILHIAGTFLMPAFDGEASAKVLKKAQEMGIKTSLDTAWDSKGNWMRIIEPCLQYLDIFMPSIEEARMITGKQEPKDIAEALLSYGIKIVSLKMGENGSYTRTHDWELHLPIYKVESVDATGAGDAYAAGFLAGVAKGWDYKDCAKFGNAVGACCVTAIGATAGIRSMKETLDFMAKFEN
ncbi:TPA: sugar kinase [bacterium]|nr:sugar kinase [bacterium]